MNMQTGAYFDNVETKYYSELAGDIFNGNDGMAGMKRDNWEGGVRVPLIWHWPGRIEGGRTIHTTVANYDMISTFADLLNVELPDNKDGRSYLPELSGNTMSEKHDFVVYASFHGPALVTQDGWKIRYFGPKDIYQLYYLPDDYREEINLAEKNKEKLGELKAALTDACDGDVKNGWFTYQSGMLPMPVIASESSSVVQ
jgi:arylsulfatase A-like enzyme